MLVFVRQGVQEILEFLSPFCTFYVYSHGFLEYILGVLRILDPDSKYFKDIENRVLAPVDEAERAIFMQNRKSILDFKHPVTKEPIFKDQDCIIIDD